MRLDPGRRSEAARQSVEPRPAGRSFWLGEPVGWWRAVSILAVGLLLALGLLSAVWLLARPLALLVAAIVLAQTLEPLVDRLEPRLGRVGAAVLVYAVLVAALGLLCWLTVPPLIAQLREVLTYGPALLDTLPQVLGADRALAERLRQGFETYLSENSAFLIELPGTLAALVVDILLAFTMAVYWSIGTSDLRRFSFSFVPDKHRDQVSAVATEVVSTMGGYLRARALAALIVGVVVYPGLLLAGVDYPLLLALLAGFGELVPVVGWLIGALPAALIALLSSPTQALIVVAIFAVVHQLKWMVLMPKLVEQQAKLPPLLVVFALLAGAAVGDLIGVLVAVPLASALRVLVLRVAAPAARRWIGSGGRRPDTPPE